MMLACFDYYSNGYLYTFRFDARNAYFKIENVFIPGNKSVVVKVLYS